MRGQQTVYSAVVTAPRAQGLQSLREKMTFSTSTTDFSSAYDSIDYQCDTQVHHYGEDSYCDSICRCSTIENVEVTQTKPITREDAKNLAGKFVGWPQGEEGWIAQKAVEAALTGIELDKEEFEPIIDRGYYGEELRGIYPSGTNLDKINQAIEALPWEQGKDALLSAAFGKLGVKVHHGAKFSKKALNTSKLNIRGKSKYSSYSKQAEPYGLFVKQGDQHFIVDGQQDFEDFVGETQRKVSVLVME
jgi:hypothetical protein